MTQEELYDQHISARALELVEECKSLGLNAVILVGLEDPNGEEHKIGATGALDPANGIQPELWLAREAAFMSASHATALLKIAHAARATAEQEPATVE